MESPHNRHIKKGKHSEELVREWLKKQKWRILAKNMKHLGVEIDLIARKAERTVIFEIKTLNQDAHLEKILSKKQKQRLKRAADALASEFPKGLELMLATVNRHKEIALFPIE